VHRKGIAKLQRINTGHCCAFLSALSGVLTELSVRLTIIIQ